MEVSQSARRPPAFAPCGAAAGQASSRGLPTAVRRTEVGGKSDLRRAVRRVTPGQGNLTDSGTEKIPPAFALRRFGEVRVKRCGKSAPRPWQHGRQAKPRTEQDQIGWRSRTARPKPPGRSLEPASNRGTRGMVVTPAQPQGRDGGQKSAYRVTAILISLMRMYPTPGKRLESFDS